MLQEIPWQDYVFHEGQDRRLQNSFTPQAEQAQKGNQLQSKAVRIV
jgi:hypothetical protein